MKISKQNHYKKYSIDNFETKNKTYRNLKSAFVKILKNCEFMVSFAFTQQHAECDVYWYVWKPYWSFIYSSCFICVARFIQTLAAPDGNKTAILSNIRLIEYADLQKIEAYYCIWHSLKFLIQQENYSLWVILPIQCLFILKKKVFQNRFFIIFS